MGCRDITQKRSPIALPNGTTEKPTTIIAYGVSIRTMEDFFQVFVMLSSKVTIIVLLAFSILIYLPGTSFSADSPVTKEVKQEKNPYAKAEITVAIISSVNNTFGYDILLFGKPIVHQPNIPGLPGNEGFTTKEKAQAVADFVVNKIRKNEMPPTVTMEELNALGVLK